MCFDKTKIKHKFDEEFKELYKTLKLKQDD